MNKTFTLKPKKEKELLKAAKPIVEILSAINSLQKKIAEIKNKKIPKKNISNNSKYYQILGINPGSSAEKIRKAYKNLALKWHPDKPTPNGFTKKQQTEEFEKVNEAANFLLDQEKKKSNNKDSEKLNQQIVEDKRLIESGDAVFEAEAREKNKREKKGGGQIS